MQKKPYIKKIYKKYVLTGRIESIWKEAKLLRKCGVNAKGMSLYVETSKNISQIGDAFSSFTCGRIVVTGNQVNSLDSYGHGFVIMEHPHLAYENGTCAIFEDDLLKKGAYRYLRS